MTKSSVPISGLACLVVTLATGCGGGQQGAPAGAPPGGRGGGPGVPVEVVELRPRPVEESTEFIGVLKSRRSSTIQPQAEGYLTKILVKSGDRVTAGTPLFEIDANAQQAAVSALEMMRAAREADAEYARQQSERAKTLLSVGASSQQEYDQATALQKTAEAQLRVVQEQIRQQQAELAYYRVLAPAAGVVGDVPVRTGERVSKATTLTTIDDNAGLEVYISVPVQEAPRLKLGLPVRLLDDERKTLATERINFISASVDDTTQTVLVKTPLDPGRGRFRSEQSVRAAILYDTVPGLTVPVVAVTRINGQFFVFVAENSGGATVARQRAVALGQVVDNEYVVRSGLKAGDKLIVSGIQKIGEGAPVTPMPAGSGQQPAAGQQQPAGGAK